MIYKDFKDLKLSALGMGCMRFPCNDKDIDLEATEKLISYAYENGINYFDTAWVYHDGKSESTLGEFLKKYPRDSFYIADKFPGFTIDKMEKKEEIFEEQLKRCQVDYFDFYLFHNVNENNIDWYLDPKYGLYDYLMKQKRAGRIKHLGFSTHGTYDTVKRFLDAYGKDMEFCQLQINWLDWEFQDAKKRAELLTDLNIPIWVMEPVRGGMLVNLKENYASILKELNPNMNNPQWAFRFIQSLDNMGVTLSGMSNLSQLKENIETFETEAPLSQKEFDTLLKIGRDMTGKKTLPCTACKYCTPECPLALDIPRIIELYNEHIYSNGGFLAPEAINAMPEDKKPSACIGCKACEAVCPQNIKISQMMTDFCEKLK